MRWTDFLVLIFYELAHWKYPVGLQAGPDVCNFVDTLNAVIVIVGVCRAAQALPVRPPDALRRRTHLSVDRADSIHTV